MRLTKYGYFYSKSADKIMHGRRIYWLERYITEKNSYLRVWLRRKLKTILWEK